MQRSEKWNANNQSYWPDILAEADYMQDFNRSLQLQMLFQQSFIIWFDKQLRILTTQD